MNPQTIDKALSDLLYGIGDDSERTAQAKQALYEAVVASLPVEDRRPEESVARDSVKVGYNLALKHCKESLALLFGISKEGGSDAK